MNPYTYVWEATANGESLLSLCCGVGFELAYVGTKDVTAVDVAQQYLDQVATRCPHAKLRCSDALSFLKSDNNHKYDVISIIDGIEHMDKETGLELIKEMKAHVNKQILLFTPQGLDETGYLKNEPHNAWGIEGADEHQTHKSGWTRKELEDLKFELIQAVPDTSQHGEPYTALMMEYRV